VNQAPVKMDDIKVQVGAAVVEDDEGVENVYEPEMTFGHSCCNAYKYYHRIGNLIFSPNTRSSRVVKTLLTFALLSICFAIITGAFDLWAPKEAFWYGIGLTILAMRVC